MVKTRFSLSFHLEIMSNLKKNCKTGTKNFFVLSYLRVRCQQHALAPMQIPYCVYFLQSTTSSDIRTTQPSKPGCWQWCITAIEPPEQVSPSFTQISPMVPKMALQKKPTQDHQLLVFIPVWFPLVWNISSVFPWPVQPLLMVTGQVFCRLSLNLSLSDGSSCLDSSYALWQEYLPVASYQVMDNFNLVHYLWR